MSRKKKNEDLEEIEKLQRENKSLRTINRSLMRHLKKLDRSFKFEEPKDEDIEQKNICHNCEKGEIVEVSLGIRKLIRCTICDYTRTEKI